MDGQVQIKVVITSKKKKKKAQCAEPGWKSGAVQCQGWTTVTTPNFQGTHNKYLNFKFWNFTLTSFLWL